MTPEETLRRFLDDPGACSSLNARAALDRLVAERDAAARWIAGAAEALATVRDALDKDDFWPLTDLYPTLGPLLARLPGGDAA